MYRYITLALLGVTGFSLAGPEVSQAQTPVGVQVQVGPAAFSYQQGYSYVAPRYVVPAPVVVGPSVVVAAPVYYPWVWDGHRWYRHERFDYRHDRYSHHR
jgi:hypothetical protein